MCRPSVLRCAVACVVTLCTASCARHRWTDQWNTLPPALRQAGPEAPGTAMVLGNRGLRFGERLAFVSQPLQAVGPGLMRGRPGIRVQCQAAPDECSGMLWSDGIQARVDLVLRGIMIRLAAVESLYLESENREAVAQVGPFPAGYHLDLGRSVAIRVDGAAAACVAGEAYVLSRTELRRVERDAFNGKVTPDEARRMAEALATIGDHPVDLCRR